MTRVAWPQSNLYVLVPETLHDEPPIDAARVDVCKPPAEPHSMRAVSRAKHDALPALGVVYERLNCVTVAHDVHDAAPRAL